MPTAYSSLQNNMSEDYYYSNASRSSICKIGSMAGATLYSWEKFKIYGLFSSNIKSIG